MRRAVSFLACPKRRSKLAPPTRCCRWKISHGAWRGFFKRSCPYFPFFGDLRDDVGTQVHYRERSFVYHYEPGKAECCNDEQLIACTGSHTWHAHDRAFHPSASRCSN